MIPMLRLSAPTPTHRPWKLVAAVLLPLVLLAACDTGPAESVYDPDRQPLPDPVISAATPAGSALAGVDEVVLAGQNFSTTPENNLVYFGTDRAQVLSATSTELVVLPRPVPAESVDIRVTVIGGEVGSENFSNSIEYRLDPAYVTFGSLLKIESPSAMTTDESGLMYVGMVSGGVSSGLKTLQADGTRSDYAATTFQWRTLASGPDGLLYAARGIRAIFRFEEGGSQQTFHAMTPSSLKLNVLTFDDDGNLWTGGQAEEIIRIAPDKTEARFAFVADVTAMKIFDGGLYAVAETVADGFAVWRFAMDANNDLGSPTKYFDISGELGPDVRSEALAFDTGGTMYLGTDRADPLELVYPNGSHERMYPNVLVPPDGVPSSAVLDLAWGSGPYLYLLRERPTGENGEGDGAEVIIRIDTRSEGAR